MPLSEEEYADQDDNPLFVAIKVQQDWMKATALIDEYADSRDRFDNTPLHAAIGYKAPDEFTLKLLKAFPDACQVHGTDDWLPLHVAAMWGSSPSIMEAIIKQYPDGLDDCGQGGVKGKTPRHYSSKFQATKALLEKPTQEWKALAAK